MVGEQAANRIMKEIALLMVQKLPPEQIEQITNDWQAQQTIGIVRRRLALCPTDGPTK
jgi:hypothetical protein